MMMTTIDDLDGDNDDYDDENDHGDNVEFTLYSGSGHRAVPWRGGEL